VNRVLLPRADIATETLARAARTRLGDRGRHGLPDGAGGTAAGGHREMIKTGGFDAVCFTSSSTVRNLVGIAGSRMRAPSSPASAPRRPRPPPSSGCGSTCSRKRRPSVRWSTHWPNMPLGCAPKARCHRRAKRAQALVIYPRQRPRGSAPPSVASFVAQTSLEPRHLVLPMFVADASTNQGRSRPCRTWCSTPAIRCAALPPTRLPPGSVG